MGVYRNLKDRLLQAPRAANRRTTALVVNGNLALQDPIVRALAAAGVDVTTAIDGHDARRMLLSMSPDALVLNLQEARVCGSGLIFGPGRLFDPNKTVAFGDVAESEWQHLVSAGTIYFRRPFDLRDFAQAVTTAVSRAAAANPTTRGSEAARLELASLGNALPV